MRRSTRRMRPDNQTPPIRTRRRLATPRQVHTRSALQNFRGPRRAPVPAARLRPTESLLPNRSACHLASRSCFPPRVSAPIGQRTRSVLVRAVAFSLGLSAAQWRILVPSQDRPLCGPGNVLKNRRRIHGDGISHAREHPSVGCAVSVSKAAAQVERVLLCQTLDYARLFRAANRLAVNLARPSPFPLFEPRCADAQGTRPGALPQAAVQLFGNAFGQWAEGAGDKENSVRLRGVPRDAHESLGKKFRRSGFRQEVFRGRRTNVFPIQLVAVNGADELLSPCAVFPKCGRSQKSSEPARERHRTPLTALEEESQEPSLERRPRKQGSIQIEKRCGGFLQSEVHGLTAGLAAGRGRDARPSFPARPA